MKDLNAAPSWRLLNCGDVLCGRHFQQIGKLLNPPKVLGGDIRDLAGRLLETCNVDEIRSAGYHVECLTTFCVEKWIASAGVEATVGCLVDHAKDMRRADVVEILKHAAEDYEINTTKPMRCRENKQQMSRHDVVATPTIATTTEYIVSSSSAYFPPQKELSNKSSSHKKHGIMKSLKTKLKNDRQKDACSKSQHRVFIVYAMDTKDHFKRLQSFAGELRQNGFDAQLDKLQFGEGYSNSSQYLMSELKTARYVVVAASPMLWKAINDADYCREKNRPLPDDQTRAISMIMTFIRDDLFQGGCRFERYLTVLMKDCKRKYVPSALSPASVYEWPTDQDKVLRRLMKVEQYKLPERGNLPSIESTVITDDLFHKGLKL